ncbi:hypothetical protein P7K49_019863 [Saguinus oedipus]|uniref:Uncharacterized protein n=1 Tax=Saguinus oedipus TaxID=9490 RepID=A0ABQ9UYW9_SAGOE|nr:hypothetical protein P7K49_019863 [Saguinus oedipus]
MAPTGLSYGCKSHLEEVVTEVLIPAKAMSTEKYCLDLALWWLPLKLDQIEGRMKRWTLGGTAGE